MNRLTVLLAVSLAWLLIRTATGVGARAAFDAGGPAEYDSREGQQAGRYLLHPDG